MKPAVQGLIDSILEAFGLVKDLEIEGGKVYRNLNVDKEAVISMQPTAKKPSAFARFRDRLFTDFVSAWWKTLAYLVGVSSLFLCLVVWLSYSHELSTKTKEVEVYRAVLQGTPDNREFIQGLDRDIKTYGHDKVLNTTRIFLKGSKTHQ